MNRGLARNLKELVNPNWVRHPTVPPFEAGLRPNKLLDEARVVQSSFEADDAAVLPDGSVALSSGRSVHLFQGEGSLDLLVSFEGTVMALAARSGEIVAAVEGRGLVQIDVGGKVTDLSQDESLRSCVTSICALDDGRLAVTVGSVHHSHNAWNHALVVRETSGFLALVDNGTVQTVASDLAWPAGVCAGDTGELLLSLSHLHRIEKYILASSAREVVLDNLPAYPGRLTPHPDGWIVAFPYVRNRLSELLLEEEDFVEEMVRTINPQEWMLPRLRNENPYTSALQLGQLRVLGMLKPWAPARSYGLVGVLGRGGRITSSFHSRVEGSQHGVTAAVSTNVGILVAVRGNRNLLMLKEGTS